MDRTIVYPGALPQDTDILSLQRDVMIAQGYLAQMVLGTTSAGLTGLVCSPTIPASMSVTVGQGAMAQMSTIDANPFGSLPADDNPLMKIGINAEAATTFACPAPTTTGQSINYLIEATFQEVDANPVALPYYNAQNPADQYSGPNNSGTVQDTVRKQVVELQLKAGTPAAAGTQFTPLPDAGWVGLYIITVNAGQTSITSSSIIQYPNAPFVSYLGRQFSWNFPANPPSSDVFLNVGDKATITFTNVNMSGAATGGLGPGGRCVLPLNINTTQGVYKIIYSNSAINSGATDTNFYLFPNNNFGLSSTAIVCDTLMNVEAFYSALATNITTNWGGYGIQIGTPYYGSQKAQWPNVPYTNFNIWSSGFYFDTMSNGNQYAMTGPTSVGVGGGPCQAELIVGTFTPSKRITAWGTVTNSPWSGHGLWLDTTTAWTSLGSIYHTPEVTSASGYVIIERLA